MCPLLTAVSAAKARMAIFTRKKRDRPLHSGVLVLIITNNVLQFLTSRIFIRNDCEPPSVIHVYTSQVKFDAKNFTTSPKMSLRLNNQ